MSSTRTMMVTGDAELYVPGNFRLSGQSRIIIAPHASLELYVGGTNNLGGQGIFNQTSNAINCQVFAMPTCRQVSLTGNSAFMGVIYAPNALLTLSGTTNAPLEATGAFVAGSIRLGGDVSFHYDENLQRIGPIR